MIPGHDELRNLLERARSGDQEAFGAALDRYAARLLVFLKRHGRAVIRADKDEEDLFQEVCATAWSALGTFEYRSPESFYLWLVALGRHVIGDRRKYLGSKGRDGVRHVESVAPGGGGPGEPLASGVSLSSVVANRELARRLERAIGELPGPERDVLERHYLAGKSLGTIAREVGCSKTTAWQRLRRALHRMQHLLESAA